MEYAAYRCYAVESAGRWEAICLDLDIAVQGDGLDEVVGSLRAAVALHLEHVATLPEAERVQFLRRPVPFGVRVQLFWGALRALAGRRGDGGEGGAQFTLSAAA